MSRPLALLIKPAGPACNLGCRHCFYLAKKALFAPGARTRMTADVLEALLQSYLSLAQPTYSFCWQGGEPLLMGLPFFRLVTDRQQGLASRGSVILNSVQTNGVLIDDALAAHLADWRFLVGVSLDGPRRVHDAQRQTRKGSGTHAQVIAGLDRLRRRGVAVNILTLVSRHNVERPRELYRYLVDLGCNDLQFIPLVHDPAGRSGRSQAITGRQWGAFLCGLFDSWWPHDVGHVSIRHVDALAARLGRGHELLCTQSSDCRHYLVIEHDGSVYPCDFFVEERHRLGNVLTESLGDLSAGTAFEMFGAAKRQVPQTCLQCRHWQLCQGDCPANRVQGGASSLCEGWQQFFAHATPPLQALVAHAQRSPSGPLHTPCHDHPGPRRLSLRTSTRHR